MLHHVEIAMGGTRVLRYSCFLAGNSLLWGARGFQSTSFGGKFSPYICRKYAISRVGRL